MPIRANMVATCAFLTSASIRKNVVSNAKSLGYTPVSARSIKLSSIFEFYLETADYPNGFPQYLQIDPGPAFNSAGVGSEEWFYLQLHRYTGCWS